MFTDFIFGGTTFKGGEKSVSGILTDVSLAAILSKQGRISFGVSRHFCNWLWMKQEPGFSCTLLETFRW